MKLIIAGSRTFNLGSDFIASYLGATGWNGTVIDEILSGTAAGVDKTGEEFAEDCLIPLKRFPADWEKFGKAAGPIRNKQMAEEGDALLLIWDGISPGSANMKKEMLTKNKPVYEVILRTYNVEE